MFLGKPNHDLDIIALRNALPVLYLVYLHLSLEKHTLTPQCLPVTKEAWMDVRCAIMQNRLFWSPVYVWVAEQMTFHTWVSLTGTFTCARFSLMCITLISLSKIFSEVIQATQTAELLISSTLARSPETFYHLSSSDSHPTGDISVDSSQILFLNVFKGVVHPKTKNSIINSPSWYFKPV